MDSKEPRIKYCQDDDGCSFTWKGITFNYKGTGEARYLCLHHWAVNKGVIKQDASTGSNRAIRIKGRKDRRIPLFT